MDSKTKAINKMIAAHDKYQASVGSVESIFSDSIWFADELSRRLNKYENGN